MVYPAPGGQPFFDPAMMQQATAVSSLSSHGAGGAVGPYHHHHQLHHPLQQQQLGVPPTTMNTTTSLYLPTAASAAAAHTSASSPTGANPSTSMIGGPPLVPGIFAAQQHHLQQQQLQQHRGLPPSAPSLLSTYAGAPQGAVGTSAMATMMMAATPSPNNLGSAPRGGPADPTYPHHHHHLHQLQHQQQQHQQLHQHHRLLPQQLPPRKGGELPPTAIAGEGSAAGVGRGIAAQPPPSSSSGSSNTMGVTEAVDGVGGGARGGAPADEEVSEDATSIRICVDMPGVNFKDLKVHLRRNGVLEVRAIRRRLGLDGKTVVRKSKISRRYAIDDRTVNVSKISADLALGVLVITAPKKPARETGTTTPPPQAQSSALAAGYLTPPEREWASMITGADATGAAAVAAAGGNTPSASPSESSSTRDSTMNNPRRVASPCVPRRSSLVGSEPSSPGIMNVRRASKTGVKFDRKVTIAEAANDADASFAAERIAAMASIEAAAASAETASLSSTSWQEGEKALAATPLQDDGTTRAMTAATVETLAALETPTAAVKTMTTAETSPGVALDSSVSFGSDVSRAVGGTGEFYSRGAILPRVSLHGSDQDVGEDGGSGEGERKEVRPGSAASFAEGNVTNGDGERGDVNNGAVPVALAVEESAADGGDNDEGNVADPADPASSSSARRVSVTP